jgi:hypothetical protein
MCAAPPPYVSGLAGSGFAWTLGQNFNFPENNCCICGKQISHVTTLANTTAARMETRTLKATSKLHETPLEPTSIAK